MTTSDSSPSGIRISLYNVDLWQKFYPINEMRVVKLGRKLFPGLDVSIEGLVPDVLYTVSLYLERVDDYKYKFIKDQMSGISQWEVTGHVLNQTPIDKKPHKDGVRSGSHWMDHPVSFSSIYITHDPEFNENLTNKMAILVSSMHKYQPVITVKRLSDGMEEEFRLTMTEFMVVTTYQLKTESNKHAKKFGGVKRSATVTPPVGSPASPGAKKTAPSSQGHQNQMMTPPTMTMTPSMAPPLATTGLNNFQNQMTTSPTPPPDGVHVTLKNMDVWQKFYPNMEMVVIRNGCRLFPGFELSIEGLDPDAFYTISIYLERVDNLRYKFSGGQWKRMSDGYSILPIDKRLHMDGVKNGAHWMKSPVSFSNVHITNDPDFNRDSNDHDPILVHSLHKYRPVITVERLSDGKEEEFRLTMTEFMVVTRYKNPEIVALKDALNNYSRRFQCRKQSKKRVIASSPISIPTPLSAVVIGPGSPFFPAAKKTSPSSQGHQNPMMTPPPTGPNTSQNQMATPPAMTMTPPPSQGPIYHQNQITIPPTMTITPPTTAPQTMAPPSMPPSTIPPAMAPPSTDPADFQNQMQTPPTTAVSPSMTPVTMTSPAMTLMNQCAMSSPPSMGATPPTPSSGGSLTSPVYEYAWNHQYGTWDMTLVAERDPVPVDDFQNSQQFGKPVNVPQNNVDFPKYDGVGTSSQSVVPPPNNLVTPPSMTAPPAHDYTMHQHWNSYGTRNMPQMSVHSPPPQWDMTHGAEQGYPQHTNINGAGTSSQQGSGDFQNFPQLDNQGTVPQSNKEADIDFLQRSSGADFDFRS